MAERFEGVSDLEWSLFENIFPPTPLKRRRRMPHASFRKIRHTLLYILITGCRWWQRWQSEGTLAALQARILGIAEEWHDSLGIWRRGWRFCLLERVAGKAVPVGGKAKEA